jgi:hypothetical protein
MNNNAINDIFEPFTYFSIGCNYTSIDDFIISDKYKNICAVTMKDMVNKISMLQCNYFPDTNFKFKKLGVDVDNSANYKIIGNIFASKIFAKIHVCLIDDKKQITMIYNCICDSECDKNKIIDEYIFDTKKKTKITKIDDLMLCKEENNNDFEKIYNNDCKNLAVYNNILIIDPDNIISKNSIR